MTDDDLADLQLEQLDGHLVARLTGELDVSNTGGLVESLVAQLPEDGGPASLVLDLAGVSYFDSSGVRLLDTVRRRAAKIGTRLVVVPNPVIRRLLAVTGLDQVVDLYDSAADAVQVLASGPPLSP